MPIGVGIIGAGFFGEKHAQVISDLPEIRLVATSRTSAAALREFADRYHARGYADYRDLLADREVEAVLIATPHHLHTVVAVHAAQAGKHILVEKPMAPSVAECDEILQATAAAGVKLMVGHNYHFAHAHRAAKRLLDAGELGDIVQGVGTMAKVWWQPNRQPWHLDLATGGGAWLTAGIHFLDLMTWLVGSPVARVSARFGARFHEQEADDVGMAFLRYANGAVATVVSTGYRTGVPSRQTTLTCTKGMLSVDHTAGVSIGRDERWQAVPDSGCADWHREALTQEWRAFARCIAQDTEPAVPGSYGRHIIAAATAALESSRLGHEVVVPGA